MISAVKLPLLKKTFFFLVSVSVLLICILFSAIEVCWSCDRESGSQLSTTSEMHCALLQWWKEQAERRRSAFATQESADQTVSNQKFIVHSFNSKKGWVDWVNAPITSFQHNQMQKNSYCGAKAMDIWFMHSPIKFVFVLDHFVQSQ